MEYLPDREKEIVIALREIVSNSIPIYTEKITYNVPFYYGKKRICYFWPSSVQWGNVKQNGVSLGFCKGNLLQDEYNYPEKGNRKQICTKTYYNLEEISKNRNIIGVLLFDAAQIDSQ